MQILSSQADIHSGNPDLAVLALNFLPHLKPHQLAAFMEAGEGRGVG